ncbi:preprotein translocase subunit SecY [Rubritalea profundi]|uniref:Protein translocase subunit SecY n=1 Tax=Rubritalea profundi TaxID=1658618 RepID=A0A2S7U2M2_9BACT|nr:preprotein translocase subunit SecY [Rubritalea profundi]PQJ29228.1 preprotein translocase subunit SecY [Rubritalea profundi]
MISAFANTWKVAELRERIIYVLVMIVIVRLGVHITLPGVDAGVIDQHMKNIAEKGGSNNGLLDTMATIFSGGGLQKLGLFALGIMPYISASILMQLMTAVMPKLSKLSREDGGRQKINQYTRFITIIIAIVQGGFLGRQISSNPGSLPFFSGIADVGKLVPNPGFTFIVIFTLTVVTGTLLLMWIGDQMTEKGIGNGTSIIITINIISSLPTALALLWKSLISGGTPAGAAFVVFLFAFLIFVVAATIAITQAQRRIAIQYAKRVVGRKQYGGQTQYLPLKLNYANVMPIIFATAILGIPTMIANQMFPSASWALTLNKVLSYDSIWYYVIAGIMIFFFSYFWVATMFQPSEISENLKRSGGYIPGIRPGEPTAKFLDFTMTRLTFAGAIFLTIIFAMPFAVSQMPTLFSADPLNPMITGFFGGTSLLIMVGVILDIMRQVETQLLQRNYDGFLRQGKLKGAVDRRNKQLAARSSNNMLYLIVVVALLFILGIVALSMKP